MNRERTKNVIQDAPLDQVLRFLMEAPEDELNRFLVEIGDDLFDMDKQSKTAFDAAFKQYGRHKREAAKREVASFAERRQVILSKLPIGREELLTIAHQIVLRSLITGRSVSMQHRELAKLTDDDLRQAVADMKALIETSING